MRDRHIYHSAASYPSPAVGSYTPLQLVVHTPYCPSDPSYLLGLTIPHPLQNGNVSWDRQGTPDVLGPLGPSVRILIIVTRARGARPGKAAVQHVDDEKWRAVNRSGTLICQV